MYWCEKCDSARKYAAMRAKSFSQVPARMILDVVEEFCQQNPRSDENENQDILRVNTAFNTKVNAIAHANSWANQHPDVADQLFELAKDFASLKWPVNETELSELRNREYMFNSEVRALGFDDLANQQSAVFARKN